MQIIQTRLRVMLVLVLLAVLWLFPAVAPAQLIIDHTCIDISTIPPAYIAKAKQMYRVTYGHTSHGSQVIAGMNALSKTDSSLYRFGRNGENTLALLDGFPKGDLGNPDRVTWAQRTREMLTSSNPDRNLVMWSWCGQVSKAKPEDIRTYLNLMSQLETDFPKVRFVYMTGHLDGSGKTGNLNQRNEQIRAYCRDNGKILFDFADIESFDPDGKVNYMELNATDGCDYKVNGVTRNWANDWLQKNPNHSYALPGSAAHSKPLNAALKGRAFWWMMARLAGWDGKATR